MNTTTITMNIRTTCRKEGRKEGHVSLGQARFGFVIVVEVMMSVVVVVVRVVEGLVMAVVVVVGVLSSR